MTGERPAPDDRTVPAGGLLQAWGVLNALRTEDPADLAQIRAARRRVALLMVLAMLATIGLVLLRTG